MIFNYIVKRAKKEKNQTQPILKRHKNHQNPNSTDLITNKASNAANGLAMVTNPLRPLLLGRAATGLSSAAAAAAAMGGARAGLALLVVPLERLVDRRRRVVDQTPALEEVEDPPDRARVADESPPSVGEGHPPPRIGSVTLHHGVPVVLVDSGALLRRRARVEELRQESDLALVNFVEREPSCEQRAMED